MGQGNGEERWGETGVGKIARNALIEDARAETVIHVAMEVAGAMKPWAGAEEDPIDKPFRTVAANWSAGIRGNVIVAVGAIRGWSDLDGDLSLCFRSGCRDADYSSGGRQNEQCKFCAHALTSQLEGALSRPVSCS